MGTAGNDTFAGLQSGAATETLSSFDSIDGGAGTDTLIIVNSAGAAFAAPEITSIEVVDYRASVAGGNLDFDGIAGATTITLKGIVGATDFTDVLTTQNVSLVDSGAGINTTITYKADTVEGGADSATLTLDNAGNSGAGAIELAGDVETITLKTTGDATRIDDLVLDAQTATLNIEAAVDFRVDTLLTAAGVTTINASGAGDVRLDDGGAAVTTFNAADATGAVHAVFDEATNVTATGGSGADTFDFVATLTRNDTIDGGAGQDTLLITPTGSIAGDLSVSNVEIIRIGDVVDSTTVDLDNVTGLTTVRQSAGTASNVTTLRDIATTATVVNFTGTGLVAGDIAFDAIVMDYDATADIDTLTVNITNGGVTTTGDATIQTGSQFNGADKVVINAADWGTGTGDVVTLGTITADSANEIEIVSNTDISLTINGMGGAAAADRLETLDMSGADAGITVTIGTDDDVTVTLGAGNDTFTGGDGDETIDGGAGNDTIDGGAGNDTMTGGAGIDTFVVDFDGEGEDTITDFTAGAGGDVIDMDGTDDVTDAGGNNIALDTLAIAVGGADITADQGLTIFDNNAAANAVVDLTAVTEAAAVVRLNDLLDDADDDAFTLLDDSDIVYVVLSDGTDTGLFRIDGDAANQVIDAGDITLMMVLEGIGDAGTLTSANFADFV